MEIVINVDTSVVTAFVKNARDTELSSVSLFSNIIKECLKDRKSKDHIKAVFENFKSAVTTVSNNDVTILARYKVVANVARNYLEFQLFLKLDLIYFTNLQRAIALCKKAKSTAEIKSISNSLAKVYKDGMSGIEYNNSLRSLIKELSKQKETKTPYQRVAEILEKNAKNLTKEDKERLIAYLERL